MIGRVDDQRFPVRIKYRNDASRFDHTHHFSQRSLRVIQMNEDSFGAAAVKGVVRKTQSASVHVLDNKPIGMIFVRCNLFRFNQHKRRRETGPRARIEIEVGGDDSLDVMGQIEKCHFSTRPNTQDRRVRHLLPPEPLGWDYDTAFLYSKDKIMALQLKVTLVRSGMLKRKPSDAVLDEPNKL